MRRGETNEVSSLVIRAQQPKPNTSGSQNRMGDMALTRTGFRCALTLLLRDAPQSAPSMKPRHDRRVHWSSLVRTPDFHLVSTR